MTNHDDPLGADPRPVMPPNEDVPDVSPGFDRALGIAMLLVFAWLLAGCSDPTPAEVDAQRARCVIHGTEPVALRYRFPYPRTVVYCVRTEPGNAGSWDAEDLPDLPLWEKPSYELWRDVTPRYGPPPRPAMPPGQVPS